MPRAYIGIGSNVGDRHAHLDLAKRELGALPRTTLIKFSEVYETPPVGPVEMGAFLNAAAALETELDPHDLRRRLAEIEAKAGRTPLAQRQKWGPRTLDLDLLLYDDRVIDTPELKVPHPLMHERWFVLKPLTDVGAEAMHPVLKQTVAKLLKGVQEQQRS
jgi:2-amino-4-hydroxy-6-hydroxymethyldihydropteridine diphosphokinase